MKHNKSAFKTYKTDELMIKFLNPDAEGVKVVVFLRRRIRRPGTLSMFEDPVFECNAKDLLDKNSELRERLIEVFLENSENLKAVLEAQSAEGNINEDKKVSFD
jgi:hypothetical protein